MLQSEAATKILLLIAGPSGAGKTVFINQFRAGTLAPELQQLLQQLLPGNARTWPQVGANDCMKRGVGIGKVLPRDWQAPGAVVHYDTAYIHRFGVTAYEQDPIAGLFRSAGQIVAVSIAPPASALRAQFGNRLARQRGAKKASHLVWKDHVRRPIERALNRLRGLDPRDTGDLYRDAEWLARCYAEWNAYVGRLIAGKPGSRAVTLEPCVDAAGRPSFRVISAS